METQITGTMSTCARRTARCALAAAAAAVLLHAGTAWAAAPANLSMRITVRTLFVGSPGTYHITVVNRGPSTTDDVVTVHDTLPPGLSFASNDGNWACSADGANVSCTNIAPLGIGSSTFALVVNVDDAAVPRVVNQFTLSYAGDTTPANNSVTRSTIARRPRFPVPTSPATATPRPGTPVPTHTTGPSATPAATHTPVPNITDLMLTKTVSGTFTVGSTGNYLLTVNNLGPATTNTDISIVDTLPAGLTVVSASGSGWTCGASGQMVTCHNGSALAPSSTTAVMLTVSIAAAAAPTTTNTATLSYAGDSNAANNTAHRPTTVRGG